MVINFLNLVAIDGLTATDSNNVNSINFCDSLSLQFFLRLFGKKVERVSGISCVNKINFHKDDAFILPFHSVRYSSYRHVILPYYETDLPTESYLELKNFLEIEFTKRVFIGISSPKQNLLAEKLSIDLPDLDFYCLGAALHKSGWHSQSIDRLNLNALFFLVTNPLRTVGKIKSTVKLFFYFLLNRPKRRELLDVNFATSLENFHK